MPVDKHLEYVEIADFAPGLWTAGGPLLMPSTGWQAMTDCRPEVGGGIRAAMKPASIPTTGITNLSTSSVLAMISFGGQGTAGADDRYIWTKDSTSNLVRVFRMNNGTSWSSVTTVSYDPAVGGPNVQLDTFKKASGVNYVLWTLWQNGGNPTVEGLREINRSTATSANVDVGSLTPTALCVMDDIVVVANGSTLYFSTSQATAMDHTNRVLPVQASRWESLINGMVYIAPSDLLCSTNSTVWSRVQGDLKFGPVVRSMSETHNVTFIQNLDMTDTGILFYELGTGIVATGDGNSFEVLSTQLDPTDFTTGDISGQDYTIIAPNGFAFDTRTKSWYRLSDITSSVVQYNARRDNQILVATAGNNPVLWVYTTGDSGAGTTRSDDYTIKTAPIRSSDGRRTKIRSVQILYNAFHTGDSFAVTINGTTKNTGSLAAGKGIANLLFREEAEYLDVQVTATADTSSHEAPMIEGLRIGRAAAHRSR